MATGQSPRRSADDATSRRTGPPHELSLVRSAAHVRVLEALDGGNQRAAVVGLLVDGDVVGGLAAGGAESLVLFSPHRGDDTQY